MEGIQTLHAAGNIEELTQKFGNENTAPQIPSQKGLVVKWLVLAEGYVMEQTKGRMSKLTFDSLPGRGYVVYPE